MTNFANKPSDLYDASRRMWMHVCCFLGTLSSGFYNVSRFCSIDLNISFQQIFPPFFLQPPGGGALEQSGFWTEPFLLRSSLISRSFNLCFAFRRGELPRIISDYNTKLFNIIYSIFIYGKCPKSAHTHTHTAESTCRRHFCFFLFRSRCKSAER